MTNDHITAVLAVLIALLELAKAIWECLGPR